MATHYWILPWLAFAAYAAAFVISTLRVRSASNSSTDTEDSTEAAIPLPTGGLWLPAGIVTLIAGFCLYRLGDLTATDYIPMRGFGLGIVAGIGIALSRSLIPPVKRWPGEISLVGLAVVIGRLWLTHAEGPGLTALLVGLILGLVLLTSSKPRENAILAIFGSVLTFTTCLGFTRAVAITDNYWADLPLVLCGLYALHTSLQMKKQESISPFLAVLVSTVIAWLMFWRIAETLAPFAAFVMGIVATAIQRGLDDFNSQSSSGLRMNRFVGAALAIGGLTASFLLCAGYGVGLFALGGAFLLPYMKPAKSGRAPTLALVSVTFSAAFLAYRLALLTAGDTVRSKGAGDIWDLIALGLGLVGVFMIASLLRESKGSNELTIGSKIEFTFAALIPVTVLAFLWQPRAFAGLLVGTALAPLFFGSISPPASSHDETSKVSLTTLLIASVMLELIPLLDEVAKPTRAIRITLVTILVVIALLRGIVALATAPKAVEA